MVSRRLSSGFSRQAFDYRSSLAIAIVCFLAPALWVNLHISYVLWLYGRIGFTPTKITFWTVFGCFTHTWMYPVVFFANKARLLLTVGIGYRLSKKGHRERSLTYQLVGALLLYPIVNCFLGLGEDLILQRNPLWFIERKTQFTQQVLPIFGDFYVFKWVSFFASTMITVLLAIIAYQVVFKYWSTVFRFQIVSVGFVAAVFGCLYWYFWLGPILY